MTIDLSFNRSAPTYDKWVKIALPNYDEIFSVALTLIPYSEDDQIEVLDLGAGTGLFSQLVLEKYPNGSFTLIDLAADMLAIARERFSGNREQFELILDDYRKLDFAECFDLVISSLSIHHLEHPQKRVLFKHIYQALNGNGVFINVDQIKAPTAQLENFYWQTWLEMVRSRGASREQIDASIQRRQIFDRDATLQNQLAWMVEAGFQNVDCVYKNHFIGVFTGTKSLQRKYDQAEF